MSIPPQDSAEHDPPIDLKLVQFAVDQVSRAAASIPITKEDEAVLDNAAELGRKSKQRALFDLILECEHHITPGLWVVYLLMLTREADERTKEHLVALPAVRSSYPSDGDDSANELLDAAVCVLESLGCVGHKPPRLAATPSEFLSRFYRLAVATEQLGNVGPWGLEPQTSTVSRYTAPTGTRRIKRLHLRLSATVGHVGQGRLDCVQRFVQRSCGGIVMAILFAILADLLSFLTG